MMRLRRAALAAVLLGLGACAPAFAQPAPTAPSPPVDVAAVQASDLDAELFYQLLLGELNVRSEEPSAGFALILDAARKTRDATLYQHAVEIAFEARSGEAALQAAQAWKKDFPQSREANRYVLQILVALNRVPESLEPLKTEIALADAKDRPAVIASVARIYGRAADKKQAAAVVEQALAPYLKDPEIGAVAWSSLGRLRLVAGDDAGALEAARQGQALNPRAEGPVLLAMELIDPKQPAAEALVRNYMRAEPIPEMRMAYARALLDSQRYPEALQQVQQVTRERPELAEAWLAEGSLQLQDNHLAQAEAAVRKYVELTQPQPASEERSRGLAQAYLTLSQIAERRRDFPQANAWLDKIENAQDLIQAQNRRASILARQGKLEEARKLLRSLPERTPADARLKVLAEIQLLRDNKHYKAAYDLLAQASAKDPNDTDLIYDRAMVAEKMGAFADMERLLRDLMVKKPEYHHAYNALGFSLAERGQRLPEARQLIEKALQYAPGDPFINDSLGWVEFRMGHGPEALRILQEAFKDRPDPEIAAHLGEVLWSMGQREQAQSIWREGLLLSSDNETLQETLKRLKVKP
jgi:predicted Zn-dependent protease